ncbi:MAG: hypothetical protein A2Y40_00030 [Candidatus Margulisbacteria bacterium GWF2_35_9]|nr:MAG: hypothetical protein A2Y40_00030 [Candidatus Margulisbacteria bacterium GWF2_35_9]
MNINFFPLSHKCFWCCLNCIHPEQPKDLEIEKIIEISHKKTINIFSHYTLILDQLKKYIQFCNQHNQKTAIICHDKIIDQLVDIKPTILIFPLFSTIPEIHNQFTNSQSFHKIISSIQHLPKSQKRIIMFFTNKDNFAELTELNTLAYTLNSNVWVIPISIFSENDFSKEDILYLKRLNLYKSLFYSAIDTYLLNHSKVRNTCYLLRNSITEKNIRLKIQTTIFNQQLFK